MDSIGTAACCEEVKRPVHRYAIHTASAEEAATAKSHLAWCGACATYVATRRAQLRAAASLVPAPVLISGHGPLTGWLLDGARNAKHHAETLLGRSAPAGDTASSATQLVAAGGTRGAGGLLAAKLLTLCVGGAAAAGGAAYCVEQGINPIGGMSALVRTHEKPRPKAAVSPLGPPAHDQPAVSPTVTSPTAAPAPASQQSAPGASAPPQPPPTPQQEFEPLSSGGGAGSDARSSSRPAKPAPAPTGGPGEFGGP
jgi:hypothetical protein